MKIAAVVAVVSLFSGLVCLATMQEPEFPEPVKEHEWLQKFVGDWSSESKGTAGPGAPEMQCKGTMHFRPLGGFWVINDLTNEMAGFTIHGVQTIGYDPAKKKYVGTWVDSALNHLWIYEGVVEGDRKLILEAKGPDLVSGGREKLYRDTWEFLSDDEVQVTSSMQTDDGKWTNFMQGTMKRISGKSSETGK